ncbi:MAG: MtnX-like HAD-IB family phosphatase [bacterium]
MAKWALVSDFDGTASVKDVGDAIVKKFVGPNCWADVDRSISRQELTVKGAYEIVYAKMSVSHQELNDFILQFELDPGFKTAAQLFADRGLPVLILSDGFDYYIDLILKRDGLQWLPRIANELKVDGMKPTPTFPHHGLLNCFHCGNCKTYHLQQLKAKGYKIAYFGDGHTDRCAAKSADLIFAKDYLAHYLTRNEINFIPFRSYSDALPKLKTCLEKE